MSDWTGRFETDHRATISDDQVDVLMDELGTHHGVIGGSPVGRLTVTVSYPAEDLRQAAVTGEAIVVRALAAAGLRCTVTAAEVMTSTDFDARMGFEPLPELLSVTEAAGVMGVTGARVRQLLDAGQLVGTKIGATWAVPKRVAEARAALGRFKDSREEYAELQRAVAEAGDSEARNEARMAEVMRSEENSSAGDEEGRPEVISYP